MEASVSIGTRLARNAVQTGNGHVFPRSSLPFVFRSDKAKCFPSKIKVREIEGVAEQTGIEGA